MVGPIEDVAEYFSLTPTTVRALMCSSAKGNPPAEWPKVVTRIAADGSWRIVREAM